MCHPRREASQPGAERWDTDDALRVHLGGAVYLFFGGADPFIPIEGAREVEARFRELGKSCRIKIYPDADHGFFCDERSSYDANAAADSWRELTGFFAEHLRQVA